MKKKTEDQIGPEIEQQNQQLAEAATSKDRRKTKRFTGQDLGSNQKLPGKVFDVWKYRTPDLQELEISVRVVHEKLTKGDTEDRDRRGRDQNREVQTEGTYFQVIIPEYAINEVDTDIERMRQKVFKLLETPFEIKWERYLRIELTAQDHNLAFLLWKEWGLPVKPAKHHDTAYGAEDEPKLNGSIEIDLKVEEWELGTTKDGRHVSRRLGPAGRPSYYEPEIRKGWPVVEAEEGTWHGNERKVLLPYTNANAAALTAIIQGMTRLKAQLESIMHPDNVAERFALAASKMRMLPAPEPKKGKK